MTRALALMSGGLDSVLAAKIIKEQGIDVIGICFKSAFFGSRNAERMADRIGIALKIIDFTEDHLEMTKKPKHGYGKNMNPCIDCHAMMMKYAGKMMDELDADFIITGEVLNQRPMSQNMKSLDIVKKESGFEDKILRPLSALNLPPTKMEETGLVDRNKLLGISGKSRKAQMELASKLNIVEYPSPAGGCMLTEPQFSNKLRDLYEHDKEDITPFDIELLKIGRHFRISSGVKALSSRDQQEYKALMNVLGNNISDYIAVNTAEHAGSTVIVIPKKGYSINADEIGVCGEIAARYSKGKDQELVNVKYNVQGTTDYKLISVKPMKDEDIQRLLL